MRRCNTMDVDDRPGEQRVMAGPSRPSRKPAGSRAKPDYLRKILTACVYDVAVETSLGRAPRLSERLGNTVLLKPEDEQPVFSFKLRGA